MSSYTKHRSDRMTPQLYSAKVTKTQSHLAPCFTSTAYVFLVENEGKKVVHVYNGDYGFQEITQEQARECLVLGTKLSEEDNKKIYNRYTFESNRFSHQKRFNVTKLR